MNKNGKVIPLKSYNKEINSKSKDAASRCWICSGCSLDLDKNGCSECASCSSIAYLLDTYLHYPEHSEATNEIVEAIWSLHYTKMQLQSILKQAHTHKKLDVSSTIELLKHQLEKLNGSLKELELNGSPLYLFLAMLAKDTELMLKTKSWSVE